MEKKLPGKVVQLTPEQMKELRPSPVQHPVGLGPFLTAWALDLFERLAHRLYRSFNEWELGFMRDASPASELFIWEGITRTYEAYARECPECDSMTVVRDLIGISSGGVPKEQTTQWERLTTLYRDIWKQMTRDSDATVKDIRRSLSK